MGTGWCLTLKASYLHIQNESMLSSYESARLRCRQPPQQCRICKQDLQLLCKMGRRGFKHCICVWVFACCGYVSACRRVGVCCHKSGVTFVTPGAVKKFPVLLHLIGIPSWYPLASSFIGVPSVYMIGTPRCIASNMLRPSPSHLEGYSTTSASSSSFDS